ncbi:hypothetical protein O8I49_02535 [Campylobacter lari]|uniref:hypothetical protein n=1 Tax=Campylobacter lari TaxID=201 RepID=UPI0017C39AF3|nr:hypothetical protein [Campylobacter lari]
MLDKEIENTTAINTYVKNKNDVTFEICLDSVMDNSCSRFLLSLINDFEEGEWRFEKFNQYIMNALAELPYRKQKEKL